MSIKRSPLIKEFKVIVSAVILNNEGKVLLAKRSEHEESFPGLWGIPGGKVEVTQNTNNTLEDTLIREVKEETGIDVLPLYYLESSCRVEGGKAKLFIIFVAQHISGNPVALDETEAVDWFNIKTFDQAILTPHTYKNVTMALEKIV